MKSYKFLNLRPGPHRAESKMFMPKKLFVLIVSLLIHCLTACQVDTPKAGDESQQPKFFHANFLKNPCTECHEKDRPAEYKKYPHGGGRNCGDCHISKDNNAGWLPRRSFSHKPDPQNCLDCHVKDRKKGEHHGTTDCACCHKNPDWGKDIKSGEYPCKN